MRADYRVTLDACVLANPTLCDLLLRLAEKPRLYLPSWSAEILDEVHRTQTDKLPVRFPKERADSFRLAVEMAFPEAMVKGFSHLIPAMTNDPKDRHVLAAACHAGSPLILTFNLRDFRREALESLGIEARHPQDFLVSLYEFEAITVVQKLTAMAGRRKIELLDLLLRMGKSVPTFASRLIDDLALS